MFIQFAGDVLRNLSKGDLKFDEIDCYNIIYACERNSWLIQTDYSTIKDPSSRYTLKSMLNEKESHAWVEKINANFLEAVITLQNVINTPTATWINAVTAVEHSNQEESENKLFTLIGNLQANAFENTKDILIPKKFKSTCEQSESTKWKKYLPKHNTFTKEDEIENLLIKYTENILGENMNLIDEEIQELLNIKEKMESLYVALAFASQ